MRPPAVAPADVVGSPSMVLELRHDDSVNGVAFSPDGRLLATAVYYDGTGAGVGELARVTHDKAVTDVAFSPNGRQLATASEDDSARAWSLLKDRRASPLSIAEITHLAHFAGAGRAADCRVVVGVTSACLAAARKLSARIAPRVGRPASTVHRVLVRHGLEAAETVLASA